jgi:signal transduction histidine kinase
MGTTYETDIVAWANEQAQLLRSGQLSALDIENIAEEILDVGKSEQRELENRMAVLLAHLLKWEFQSLRRSKSWERTIKEQRKSILIRLKKTPSLHSSLSDPDWLEATWSDAVTMAIDETGRGDFPNECPWTMESILADSWFPA